MRNWNKQPMAVVKTCEILETRITLYMKVALPSFDT